MRVQIVGVAVSAVITVAAAPGAEVSCDWWSIDAGGGTSSGGSFVGQVDAMAESEGAMTGGAFVLAGGYWTIELDSCPIDLTGDGVINGADLAIVLGSWLTAGPGDLDGSGVVNGADLAMVLGAWGPCP
jgi:hypothetical protein